MKPFSLLIAVVISTSISGCSPQPTASTHIDKNIPTITIVAKRMTEDQKRVHDQEIIQQQTKLVQR